MAPERTTAPAAAGLAGTQVPSAPKEGPVGIVRRLVQGLRSDNAEQAAGVVASFDLALPTATDGVAAEVGGLGGGRRQLGLVGRPGEGCRGLHSMQVVSSCWSRLTAAEHGRTHAVDRAFPPAEPFEFRPLHLSPTALNSCAADVLCRVQQR